MLMMNLFWLSSAALLASASAFAPTNNGGSIIANSHRSINLQMSNDDTWYEDDTVVTLVPKFKIKEGMKEQFVELLPKFLEFVKANEAESCVHYGFVGPSEDGFVICREGYTSGEAVLAHLDNVGDVLNQALEYADIVELMAQGPAAELEKLKEPLADFGPTYYPLAEGSFRNKKMW